MALVRYLIQARARFFGVCQVKRTFQGVVGTVSGTSISFGSVTEIDGGSATAASVAVSFDTGANKAGISYGDGGDNSKPTLYPQRYPAQVLVSVAPLF